MNKKWMTRAVALALTAAFLPTYAMAGDWDLNEGSITVSASDSGQNVSQEGGRSEPDASPVISSGGKETGNTVTIKADSGATANVTVKDANINTGGAAIKTEGEGSVNLNIEGSNTASSGTDHAGVEKGNEGKLTIGSKSGDGKLEAKGGDKGAGIGGGYRANGSNIEITGGEITATGGSSGAGIGGAYECENITISGGKITANGGPGAAGIGGGGLNPANNPAKDITISGGTVNAKGGNYGAGIGGGIYGNASNITITGGKVTAEGGTGGAGIGGGLATIGEKITISGSAEVSVAGGMNGGVGAGAAIGWGGNGRDAGREVTPDTSGLYTNGKIDYYQPGADIANSDPDTSVSGTVEPPKKPDRKANQTSGKTAAQEAPAAQSAALYRVVDSQGKDILCKAERQDSVLTLTVETPDATLTGYLWGLQTLAEEGIETIVLTDGTREAQFRLADLLAKGTRTDSFALNLSTGLTLNGEAVEL